MQDDEPPKEPQRQGFLSSLLQGFIRDGVMMWGAVAIGCLLGLIFCVMYGLPLGLSLVGGAIVLAIYVAWDQM